MKKSVSNKVLDRIMSYILEHPYMSDDTLNELAKDPEILNALETLKAMHAISYKVAMGGKHLYSLNILDDGILYFYQKSQQRNSFWKGFITGIVSTVAASLLINLIMWIIAKVGALI